MNKSSGAGRALAWYATRKNRTRKNAWRFATGSIWGKPVPGFGDARGKLLILDLPPRRTAQIAPAHVHRRSVGRFSLRGPRARWLCQSGALVAPPGRACFEERVHGSHASLCPACEKPLPSELWSCRPYLERELEILRPRALLALGGIAMRAYLGLLKSRGEIQSAAAFPFSHGASYTLAWRSAAPICFLSPKSAKYVHRQAHTSYAVTRSGRYRAIP